ncbi:MAG: PEGA domain-containing protein [Desulfuromonadales bacterium]
MNRLIEIHDSQQIRRLDESSLPLQIGTDETAHIRLEGVRGIVAYVGESRNHLFLQPADNIPGNLVYHNDEPLTASVWLKSGDTTRIAEAVIHWHLSGQRVEVQITKASADFLRPPIYPPESHHQVQGEHPDREQLLPVMEAPASASGRFRSTAVVLFFVLLVGAMFVLLANPLEVEVTPVPDSLSVSGFPPVVPFGDRFLGISGSYTVHAEKQGFLPLEKDVEIDSSGRSYSFTMEKLPGLIDLISNPAGANVSVDGTPVGVTPLQGLSISAGSHLIRFAQERYLSVEKSVTVEGLGARQSLEVDLEPAWAKVSLQTAPEGAMLTIDGTEQGETPLDLELIAGTHQLVFRKPKFVPLEVELAVTSGQELAPPVYRLDPAPGTLTIASVPVGSMVTVDGGYMGLTPLSVQLSSGSVHDLRLTLAGHLPVSQKLRLEPEEQRKLDVQLKPEYGTVFITSTPAGAELYIDGTKQERITGRFRLTTRAHTLELKAENYASLRKTVTPQTGYSQRIELDLQPKQTVAQATSQQATAARQTTGLGQQLILVRPKPFLMGASRQEAGRRANENERQVSMLRSYYLSAREVTNTEFKRFQAQHSSGMSGNFSLDVDSHPVVNITWDDAARFLNWLSQMDGLPPYYHEENGVMVSGHEQGIGYRLPTEAEWAFAARMAGQQERVRYPWPGKYPPQEKAGNFADESARHLVPVVIEGYTDGFAATAPTGSFPVNPAGFYDLGGNVAEWCHDYYVANPAGGENTADPMGPTSGTHHVVRGSSWRDASITELRFSYRRYSREPANDIGFRIARYAK